MDWYDKKIYNDEITCDASKSTLEQRWIWVVGNTNEVYGQVFYLNIMDKKIFLAAILVLS